FVSFKSLLTIYLFALSLHDALPILGIGEKEVVGVFDFHGVRLCARGIFLFGLQRVNFPIPNIVELRLDAHMMLDGHLVDFSRRRDRKSTRLNSSHEWISYAVFCLKK